MIDFTKCTQLQFNSKNVVELYYNGNKVWQSGNIPIISETEPTGDIQPSYVINANDGYTPWFLNK